MTENHNRSADIVELVSAEMLRVNEEMSGLRFTELVREMATAAVKIVTGAPAQPARKTLDEFKEFLTDLADLNPDDATQEALLAAREYIAEDNNPKSNRVLGLIKAALDGEFPHDDCSASNGVAEDVLVTIMHALMSENEARRDEALDAAYVEIERLRAVPQAAGVRPIDCPLANMPPGDVLDHEAAYDLFEALREATAQSWHEIAARHLAYHRHRALSLPRPVPSCPEWYCDHGRHGGCSCKDTCKSYGAQSSQLLGTEK